MSDYEEWFKRAFNRQGSTLVSAKYDENFESMKWVKELPFLDFPSHWLVKIVPPFVGAVIRFKVKHRDRDSEEISIYFDGYNNLGYMDGPYWEIYPVKDEVIARFMLGEEKAMLQAIEEALSED